MLFFIIIIIFLFLFMMRDSEEKEQIQQRKEFKEIMGYEYDDYLNEKKRKKWSWL